MTRNCMEPIMSKELAFNIVESEAKFLQKVLHQVGSNALKVEPTSLEGAQAQLDLVGNAFILLNRLNELIANSMVSNEEVDNLHEELEDEPEEGKCYRCGRDINRAEQGLSYSIRTTVMDPETILGTNELPICPHCMEGFSDWLNLEPL